MACEGCERRRRKLVKLVAAAKEKLTDMLGVPLDWDADDPSTEDSSSSVVQSAPDGSTEGPNK